MTTKQVTISVTGSDGTTNVSFSATGTLDDWSPETLNFKDDGTEEEAPFMRALKKVSRRKSASPRGSASS